MVAGSGSGDGRQARWQQHNEDRRRQIIDAAIAVVEDGEPGAEVHVWQIAERAGLNRSVVYRHFADRGDLDRAVRASILEDLWGQLLPAVSLDGTVPEIIERIVGTYVRWAVAHPALHRLADHDTSAGADSPLEQGLERIADEVAGIIALGMMALGAEVDEEAAAALDPLVHAIVGAVFSAVRRWLARPDRTLSPDMLIELVSQSVWYVVDGHARSFGIAIDPARPVQDLAADALAVSGREGRR